MTDKLLVKRELLERLAAPLPGDNGWQTWHTQEMIEASKELRVLLDAPRQPEGEGLEVVAYECLSGLHVSLSYEPFGDNPVPLWRAPDAQRAIAELRDQLLKAAEQSLKATELLSVTLSERDALRQQRDKLAGLLREAIPDVEFSIGEGYEESAALFERIDAALAEVKPCQESPHPAAT